MRAAQHTLAVETVVASHKVKAGTSGSVERLLVETFTKKSATGAEPLGLDDEHFRETNGCTFQIEIRFCNVRNM